MTLHKNGATYELTDETQISAFLSSGWRRDGDDIAPPQAITPEQYTKQYSASIMDELQAFAALNEIDVSLCETRQDIYAAFVAFGQSAPVDNTLDFDSMSDDELQAFAALNEIDISKAKNRTAVIKLLQDIKQGGE